MCEHKDLSQFLDNLERIRGNNYDIVTATKKTYCLDCLEILSTDVSTSKMTPSLPLDVT